MLPDTGGRVVGEDGWSKGTWLEQAARIPTIAAIDSVRKERVPMGLILLEALLALVILVAIVWWTMFAGRKKGEIVSKDEQPPRD
ncbi:hypothetical protein GCM10027195_38220 [Comamonas sediminis]|jgi:hypothetical protein